MRENMAEKITNLLGSWKFLVTQTVFLVMYVAYNHYSTVPFDPYPLIFLNLILSFQAAYTAPIILMSHSLMAKRDRDLAEQDHENTKKILAHIEKLQQKLIEEVDEAVEEITDAIEADDDEEAVVIKIDDNYDSPESNNY